MKTDTTKAPEEAAEGTLLLGDDWFDPLEAGVRTLIRGFIEELLEAELDAALGRDRYERPRLAGAGVGVRPVVAVGHRHGHRERQLMGTLGPVTVRVPRARLETSQGKTAECATSISHLVALGVRQDGQKVLLAVKNTGGVN
jgi:putative transposase